MKMKEKGFTLVELLTVFAILSIILGMVVVNVNNYSSKQREKDYENLVKIIEENAKVLVNKNEDLFVGVTNNASSKVIDVNGNTLNGCKFSYDLLVDNKLMDEDTVNPVDNKAFYDNNYSIITTLFDKGTYNYELKQNVNDDYTNCRDIDNISIKNMNLSLTSTSNSVTAKVTVSNTLDFVRKIDWVLYDEKDNKLKEVSSENLIYNFGGLKSNKLYKVKAKLVSVTNKYQEKTDSSTTLSVLNPYITMKNNPTTPQNGYLYSQNIDVTYNGGGVTSPTYYLKSTKNGNIDSSLNISCGTGSMPSNCTETQSTTILSENMWYKVPKNISISYNNENDKIGTIYAVTFDGNNYSSAITATLDKIDKTPPTCSWNGESTSWTDANRTISAICSDSGSGCKVSNFSKSYTNGTTKNETLSYTMTDNVGNTTVCSKAVNVYVDKTDPTCSWSGESTSWTNGNRTITATCSDSGSGCKVSNYPKSYTSGTTKTETLSYAMTDNVGHTTICSKDVNVYVDKNAPTCSWSGESTSWTNGNRTITATCNDSGSGCKTSNYSKSYTSGTKKTETLSYTMTDNAENSVNCSKTVNVYVDKEAPSINYSQILSNSGFNLSFSQTDSGEIQSITMSGTSSASGTSSLNLTNLKTGTYTIVAKDKAGNSRKKVVRIFMLAYPNYRYGSWGTNWYKSVYGDINNTSYSYTNGLMIMGATPSTLQGRLVSYYSPSVSLSSYDNVAVYYYINNDTTSSVYFQLGLNGSILSQKQASSKNSGGLLFIQGDISNDNSSKQITYIANGGSNMNATIGTYILSTGMISVRDN